MPCRKSSPEPLIASARRESQTQSANSRGGFLRSEISDLLEIYPSGYQLKGDFGTLTGQTDYTFANGFQVL